MQQKNIPLMYWPGGENDGGGADPETKESKTADKHPVAETIKPKKKGFIEKLRDALRDWSNGDHRDQIIDDSTP
jgi:hypothetical protein